MRTIIVISGTYSEFVDFIYSMKVAPLYDINKNDAPDFNRHGAYAIIGDIKFLYSRSPEKLWGIERGTEVILTGAYENNDVYKDPVITRFRKIDYVQI